MAKFYARLVTAILTLSACSIMIVLYAPRTDSVNGVSYSGNPDIPKTSFGSRSDRGLAFRRRITLATDDEKTVQQFSWPETKMVKKFCSLVNYTNVHLPQMSVIICFHGKENMSNLLHTVHAVYQRTPPHLLKEIILVDDYSRNDDFGIYLELYVAHIFGEKVRILRNAKKMGLIRSRLKGIRAATAEVVAVMDSHVEVQPGWAEPLLREIDINPKTLAASYIDWMERKGDIWEYRHGGTTWKTYFDWTFIFGWQTMSEAEVKARKSLIEPIRAPVIIGTIFAIRRDYFFEVGAFDEGMQLWGGENLDLPVRVWLCGGRVVNVPCSRAGHMENAGSRDYRLSSEWEVNKHRNYRRFAEVWAGDFKKYFYLYTPQAKNVEEGDISERVKLRSVCTRNFSWYLQEVFPELGIPDKDSLAWGQLHNEGSGQCLDTHQSLVAGQGQCGQNALGQNVFWSNRFHLRFPVHMLIYNEQSIAGVAEAGLYLAEYIPLHNTSRGSKYFHVKNGPIIEMETGRCLDGSIPRRLRFTTCSENSAFQKWSFQHYTGLYDELLNQNSTDPVISKSIGLYLKFVGRFTAGLRPVRQVRTLRPPR